MPNIAPSLLLLVLLLLSACGPASPPQPTATALSGRTGALGSAGGMPADGPAVSLPPESREIINKGGFALTFPDGWQVMQNEGAPILGGGITLAPQGSDPKLPAASIIVHLADQPALVRSTLPASPTVQAVLDAMLAGYRSNPQTALRDIRSLPPQALLGTDAHAFEVLEAFPDGREQRIRTLAAQLPDTRWLMVYAAAPAATWDAEVLAEVLDSLHLATPEPAATPLYPLPPDAREVTQAGAQVSFVSEMPPPILATFLREAFTRAGAREDSQAALVTADSLVLRFTQWRGSSQPVLIFASILPETTPIGTPGQTIVTIQLEQ